MAAKDMPPPRRFSPNPPVTEGPPFSFGLAGPPGSGKTVSALRIGRGMSRVRGGKPALIDTEAGRSLKYQIREGNPTGEFDFDYFEFTPPFIPAHFMDAIREAAKLNPSAIIVDNASDEHEGPGGVLDWHDAQVPNMKGNEWAAWNVPKASRRVLTAGIQQIRIPIIMTFRARPKTTTKPGTKTPVALGYMPIAGDELLGIMDLMCLLPPKSNGVATWRSDKAGEDFTIKLPGYLARYIEHGTPLNEDLGEALALWQAGRVDPNGAVIRSSPDRKRTPQELVDDYIARVNACADLEALRSFQMAEKSAAFVEKIKAGSAGLFEAIIDAQSRKAAALRLADQPDDEDLGVPSTPPATEEANNGE